MGVLVTLALYFFTDMHGLLVKNQFYRLIKIVSVHQRESLTNGEIELFQMF